MASAESETLFLHDKSCPCALVLTDSAVWFVDRNYGAVIRLPKAGGREEVIASGFDRPGPILLNGDSLVVTVMHGPTEVVSDVVRVGLDGMTEPIGRGTVMSPKLCDAEHVFLTHGGKGTTTIVGRIPSRGGPVEELAELDGMYGDMRSDDNSLYVGSADGLYRISKPDQD